MVDSSGKAQMQPVLQGLFAPQLPPQVAEAFASLRNCRAETVPAQRTPMTSAVKNIDFIFFMMLSSLLQDRTCSITASTINYFPGLAATNWHVPDVKPG